MRKLYWVIIFFIFLIKQKALKNYIGNLKHKPSWYNKYCYVTSNFCWIATDQGRSYWDKLNSKWIKRCQEF